MSQQPVEGAAREMAGLLRGSTPRSTYRLQISADFTLHAAADLVDYLRDLGISHVYASPLLAATPGSAHGYDTIDFGAVDPERGGVEGFAALDAALRDHGLGLVVDIVPNHMGVGVPEVNDWWWDVLRHGRTSRWAPAFDVDWDFGGQRLRIPVLADSPTALDDLHVQHGELRYFEHRYPLASDSEDAGGTPREVHDRQHYELVSWRRADTDLNYRRFFAVNDLAAVTVDRPEIFDAVHSLVLRWLSSGAVEGLRIDHPDGLADPGGYLRRLAEAAPGAWLVVEKILQVGESLPASWPVSGTTGYDALNEVGGVFLDPAGEPVLTDLDTELAGVAVDFPAMEHDCKRAAADGILQSEVRRLARLVPDLPGSEDALAELLACFPVYRSYLPDGADRLQHAVDTACLTRPDLAPRITELHPRLADAAGELAVRFQQTSGMVMAKGVEDTAFYRWSRLVSLNEVGGEPTRFGLSIDAFHAACGERQNASPNGMTTLSTHDTKRSEDVRARLAVVAEIPQAWANVVRRWNSVVPLADLSLAHLLWQNIVGAWPLDRERAHAYAEKAAREAGVSTSWADPVADFEVNLHALVDAAYDHPEMGVELVVDRIKNFGWSNSLGMKLLQLMMPGVPDAYQGSELWDHSLVDPDNRRQVDYEHLRELLIRLDDGWLPPIDSTGAAKMLVVSRALRVRIDRPLTAYRPVLGRGPAADHLVGFDRGGVIALATRLPLTLAAHDGWQDTEFDLPAGEWADVLTGTRVEGGRQLVADMMQRYPVALLVAG